MSGFTQETISAGGGGGGDASAANQLTEIAKLTSIDDKTPALGQALAANSVPIVLTVLQLSALTPPAAITGFATESTLSSLNNKIPSTVSLSDAFANPTTFSIDAKISGYNGSSWDRIRTGLLAQTSSPVGFINSIPFAQYNFANLSLLDTETAPLQITDAGFLRSEEQMAPLYESSIGRAAIINGPTNSGSYAHDYVIFSEVHLGTISAGFASLLAFSITNFQTSALYLHIFNKASNPSVGSESSTLLWSEGLVAGEITNYKFSGTGLYGSDGLAFFISTSPTSNVAPSSDSLLIISVEKI